MGGQSRLGGKIKPLKKKKSEQQEVDPEDAANWAAEKLRKKAEDEMRAKAAGKGPLSTGKQGIKKSGKK